jgi:transcriptional regulator with XRE-family HTH domain
MRENKQAVEEGEGGTVAAEGRVFTARLYRARKGCRVTLSTSPPPPRPVHVPVRRPARIAIMLALAHTLQQAIDEGKVKDAAEVARRLGVSRSRVAQILELALLPVSDQERVLWLEAVDGRDPGQALVRPGPASPQRHVVAHRSGVDKIGAEGQ